MKEIKAYVRPTFLVSMIERLEEKGAKDITVIRAGIRTNDVRYRSDALEALQCLQDNELASRISLLVGQDYRRITKAGMGRLFSSFSDAIAWCVSNRDEWISINGKRTSMATGA